MYHSSRLGFDRPASIGRDAMLAKSARSIRESLRLRSFFPVSGGHSVGVTPDPFPNSVVKPHSADGTARGTVWESRTLPDYFCPASHKLGLRGFFFAWSRWIPVFQHHHL